MADALFKKVELVGTSSESISAAIVNAVAKAESRGRHEVV